MFTLFGQFGGPSLDYFATLDNQIAILDKSITKWINHQAAYPIAFGQSPNSSFFPLNSAFQDMIKRRTYCLGGYLWSQDKFPTDEIEAKTIVSHFGDQIIDQRDSSLPENCGGIYIIVAVEDETRYISITTDFSGLLPLYFSFTADGAMLFSTHIRPLAKMIHAKIDEDGVIQHSLFHHTIGRRTLYKDISRLNAGETIVYQQGSGQASFIQPKRFYSQLDHYKSDEEAADEIWKVYLNGIKPFSNISGKKGVLLSGGFDSRLVVAGFRQDGNDLVAVTFGDNESWEVKIAKRVCKVENIPQNIYSPISDHNFNNEQIQHLIDTVEFVNFPYCASGGISLKAFGAISASTGYGGESFFGGQAYTLFGPDFSQKQRVLNAIKRLAGLPDKFTNNLVKEDKSLIIQQIMKYYTKNIEKSKKMFAPRYQLRIENIENILLEDITTEVQRYFLNHPDTVQQLFERFWLEHHVLKHFGRQELTLMDSLPIFLPTVYHAFMRKCSNLDPYRKVDHGIYIKLVKRHLGNLSEIPTANIPINLRNPELFLWISRWLRATKDQNQMRQLMKSHGKAGHRYGWSNFEVWLRESTFFENCLPYISPEIYSHNYLENKIQKIKNWESKVYSGQEFLTMITVSQILSKYAN